MMLQMAGRAQGHDCGGGTGQEPVPRGRLKRRTVLVVVAGGISLAFQDYIIVYEF